MQQNDACFQVVDHNVLRRFCARLFSAAGLAEADARLVSDSLVASNLRGIDSHGVARIPHYLRRLAHGSINSRPQIGTERRSPSTAVVDGDHGLGQLVMQCATESAVELAREAGSGWVSVRNSSHCGALAYYGLQIADAGMIGLVFTHVDPMVIPYDAQNPFCGTNPICIAAPRTARGAGDLETGAFCLDMATSKVPWNIIVNACIEQVPVESGWGADKDGNDTTDPRSVVGLYPVGGYKGSGLGLAIDVLCSLLSDSPYGPDIPAMYGDFQERRLLGGLVGAIDIGRFLPPEHFFRRLDDLLNRWSAQPAKEAGGRVFYPGEPELVRQQQRLRDGIPIGEQTLRELDEAAAAHEIDRLPRRSEEPTPQTSTAESPLE
ncbi:MAG: Ldh family oxidoreductase [Pirellulales bacterium]|nr:Ldh family oxidoreductase [Pirellulales bacterium]